MYLKEVIEFLEKREPGIVAPVGFSYPHSYRGYYEDLAFVPKENVTVGDMLASAKKALGATYEGWKGGEFTMREYTTCWLAEVGCTGEGIGDILLKYMVGEITR